MEKVGCGRTSAVLKKGKKKHAKDELDRLKQAEKKKRRLEKALATSAAIRSELEKKKQKKIEEQQRLDKEGAAIAESVALNVLLGEDTDECYPFIWNNDNVYNPREHPRNIGFFMGYQNFGKYSAGGLGGDTDGYKSDCQWNDRTIGQVFLPPGMHVWNLQSPYYEEKNEGADLSVGIIAAQAVSSLQIAENSHEVQFTGPGARTVIFNRMLGDCNLGNKVDLYKEY